MKNFTDGISRRKRFSKKYGVAVPRGGRWLDSQAEAEGCGPASCSMQARPELVIKAQIHAGRPRQGRRSQDRKVGERGWRNRFERCSA